MRVVADPRARGNLISNLLENGLHHSGELFRAEPALRELARRAQLTIEPSFG